MPEASDTERHQKPGVDHGKPSSVKSLRQMLADVNNGHDGGTLYQLDDNGNAVSPGEASPRIAQVVNVDPSIIVDDSDKSVDLKNTSEVREWILKKYSDVTVQITDDGTIQKFTATGLRASAKKRGNKQRQAYAALDDLLRNALYDKPEEVNQKHEKMNDGQLVYYYAANIGGGLLFSPL